MENTVEDVKKYVMDANTQAAVAALEKQVEDTRKVYLQMNQNAENAAKQGRIDLQKRMELAGIQQPVSSTAGVIMDTAAGEARRINAQHQDLNLQKAQNNIQYLKNADQERQLKLQQQQAQQKAATLAQYGDFSGYGELGYSPEQIQGMKSAYDAENNKPEEYGGLESYAKTLLDLYGKNAGFDIESNLKEALQNGLITQRDYQAALIAARGIVPGASGKKGSGTEIVPGASGKKGSGTEIVPDASGKKGSGTEQVKTVTPVNPLQAAAQEAADRVQTTENGKYVVTSQEDWEALRDYYQSEGKNVNNEFVFRGESIKVPGYGKISYERAEQLEKEGKIVMSGVDASGDPIYTVPFNKNAGWEQMIY